MTIIISKVSTELTYLPKYFPEVLKKTMERDQSKVFGLKSENGTRVLANKKRDKPLNREHLISQGNNGIIVCVTSS
jgi:hypothetical protein